METFLATYVPARPQDTWDTTGQRLSSVARNQPVYRIPQGSSSTTAYTLVSGALPPGLVLANNGVISGTPIVSAPTTVTSLHPYQFTVNMSGTNRTFSMTVVDHGMLNTGYDLTDKVSVYSSYCQLAIGNIPLPPGATWTLRAGQLPPRTTLDPAGIIKLEFESRTITTFFGGLPTVEYTRLLPFTRDQFIGLAPSDPGVSAKAWNSWLGDFLTTTNTFDYQFVLELQDVFGMAIAAHTFRIMVLKAPSWSSWFVDNARILNYNPDQEFFLFASTLDDYITWSTDSSLGTVVNGSTSTLSLKAQSRAKLEYVTQPFSYNRFPQGVLLNRYGDISGRFSFRCSQDDPGNLPTGDYYDFVVRARTLNSRSYSDRRFNLTVQRHYTRPVDNIYIRAFPPIDERLYFDSIMRDPDIFPSNLIYRPNDPWFGQAKDIKFLFSAGVNIATTAEYETWLQNNHYTKTLRFGEPATAVAYDSQMQIKYEVVYLPIVDEQSRSDVNLDITVPNIIDLRSSIVNYYVRDGQSYYLFRPNGLQNMQQIIKDTVGYWDLGALPSWMTSLQPVEDRPGEFYLPKGLVYAVVLAYTVAGGSQIIAHRLKQFNFNNIRFEFDRYQLDNSLSQNYRTASNSYVSGSQLTTFDGGSTIYDSNSTKMLENLEYYRGPGEGDKYLKFPKSGVFK